MNIKDLSNVDKSINTADNVNRASGFVSKTRINLKSPTMNNSPKMFRL